MRPRTIFFLILVGLGLGQSLRAQQPADSEVQFNQTILPFMEQNCHVCHNATVQRGGMDLTQYKTFDSVQKHKDIWRDIVAQVETGSMPPRQVNARIMPATGLPTPSEESKQVLLTWIKSEFARQDSLIKAAAGRVTARRLNKTEYNNTIQDLLGIKACG